MRVLLVVQNFIFGRARFQPVCAKRAARSQQQSDTYYPGDLQPGREFRSRGISILYTLPRSNVGVRVYVWWFFVRGPSDPPPAW